MVHIIKSCSIEAPHHIHHIIKNDSLMEGTLLWHYPCSVNTIPFPIVNLVAVEVIEAFWIRINTTKYEYSIV